MRALPLSSFRALEPSEEFVKTQLLGLTHNQIPWARVMNLHISPSSYGAEASSAESCVADSLRKARQICCGQVLALKILTYVQLLRT